MKLNYKQCDIQRNDLVGLTNNFYPQADWIKLKFSLFLLKIRKLINSFQIYLSLKYIYQQVIEGFLFVAGNSKQGMFSAIRSQTQVLNLSLEEMQTEIIKRSQLNKLWVEIIDSTSIKYDNPLINNFKRENKIVRKCGYKLKINNIDKTLEIKDIKRKFKACGSKVQKFYGINGKTNGEGYVTFDNEEKARKAMELLEDYNLGGNNKLNLELKKFYFYYNEYKN